MENINTINEEKKYIEFKVKSLRNLINPVQIKNSNKGNWVCYVNLNNLPEELENWMTVNPREQNLKTNVSQKILNSIEDENEEQCFHELNRGLVLLVEDLFVNKLEENIFQLKVSLTSEEQHGLVDGGHTFKCILKKRNSQDNQKLKNNYVMLQIFKGIENVAELASARNTSVEVDTKSLAELEKHFDDIKDIFKDNKYDFLLERITWKQFQNQGISNSIDVREIVALISLFNPKINTSYNSSNNFIQVYSSKEYVLKKYLEIIKNNKDEVSKMKNILSEIIDLWEYIQCDLPIKVTKAKFYYKTKVYSNSKTDEKNPKKWLKINKTFFKETKVECNVPKGLIYPILGSFSQLIIFDKPSKQYKFKYDPIKVWNNVGIKIAERIMESSKNNGDNQNAIGKDKALWNHLYDAVLIDINITNKNKY